jgi:hypothetical protein
MTIDQLKVEYEAALSPLNMDKALKLKLQIEDMEGEHGRANKGVKTSLGRNTFRSRKQWSGKQ